MAKTFTSNTYEGRYLQLSISESVDTKNNRSTLTWTLKSAGGSSTWYSIAATKVVINGTTVYSKGATDWDDKVFPAAKGSVSGTINVAHNSDGSKSINIGFSTRVYYNGAEEYGGTMTLTKIDRTAPTVKVTASAVTATSVKITVTSSATADVWKYSINNGSSYVTFNSTTGTSKTYTITGLSSNTTYKIKAQARKDSNEITGTSAAISVKTLGASAIATANDISADATTVNIVFKPTVYNSSYTHTLSLKNGSTAILTFSDLSLTNNTSKTIALTAAQRTTLLNAMSNIQSFTGTLELKTYSGSTQIGSATTKSVAVRTSAANSGPTLSGFTYVDSNATSVAVTENDQILIQNISTLVVTASTASAKNGASIIGYSVKAGSTEQTSSTTTINVGSVSNSGSVALVVTAIDSRGYTASATKTITVIAYKSINIIGENINAHRRNEVDEVVKMCVEGTMSAINITSDGSTVNKNRLVYAGLRTRRTSASSWNAWHDITTQFSSTNTHFSLGALENEYEIALTFAEAVSWYMEVKVQDRLTEDTYLFTIPQGIPLLAFRKNMVGINNRDPQVALDVVGDAFISGKASINGMPVYAELATGQSWSSGYLDVPNISKYSLLIFKLSGESTRMLCVNSDGIIRGGTVWVNASGHIISYSVSATISGDRITYVNSGYMRHNASGNHGAWTQVAVTDIIGII